MVDPRIPMKNRPLQELQRQLAKLEADCRDFLRFHETEMKAIEASRTSSTLVPQRSSSVSPTLPAAEAAEPKQKTWRFTDQQGRISDVIAKRAASDPVLLEAIAQEIKERTEYEKQ
jgi:hypothetical protein